MLLAIDAGNTQTVVGLFDDVELVDHWRIATVSERTSDELALMIQQFLGFHGFSFHDNITGVSISSGVPMVTAALREMTERYFGFPALVIEPGIRTGMPILYDNPKEVGADRIVNALAAFTKFGGPCVVVDFGTATTYDAVSERGEYLGGAIAPGIQVSAEGLFQAAARLPRVELIPPRAIIGKNTVEALQSGLLYGTAAEIDGVVERMQKELGGHAAVVATGGLASVIVPLCERVDHHEPWLTLEGLRLVFDRNTARDE